MSLSPQEVADAINALGLTANQFAALLRGAAMVSGVLDAAGFDTSEKFGGMIAAVNPLVTRNILLAKIAKLRDDAAAANTASQQAIQAVQATLATSDDDFNKHFGV